MTAGGGPWARSHAVRGGLSRAAVVLVTAAICLILLPLGTQAAPRSQVTTRPAAPCPWIAESLQHHRTAPQLAAQVVARMTPRELAGFVVLNNNAGVENFNIGVPSLCIPTLTLVDGPSGVSHGARGVTQFPSELSVAASFNPSIALQVGRAMGQEAHAKGYDVLQAPDLNLIRAPLSGRAFETYGEDPFLASIMGVAAIEGIQSTGVMAQAKHLGGYTQENGRARLDQVVATRALAEVYDQPFAAATSAHVASIMCAMGSLNGINTCSSRWLNTTLRGWGFRGFVRSDYKATAQSLRAYGAGVSLVKPGSIPGIVEALRANKEHLVVLRRAVAQILTQMFAYGLVEHPRAVSGAVVATSRSHTLVALRSARQGIVLLQNDRGVLPLAPHGSVAVIGVDARGGVVTRGGGSSGVHASFLESPLVALRSYLPRVHFLYAAGGPHSLEFDALASRDITGGSPPPAEVRTAGGLTQGHGDVAIDFAKAVTPNALTAGAPGRGDGWSRWSVRFRAEKTGAYVIGLEDLGDTWLRLNSMTVLADRGLHSPRPQSAAVHLVARHQYTLVARWWSLDAAATPRLGIDFVQPQIDAAVAAARHAHSAVVFASNLLSEGADAPSLYLEGDLNALIEAVAAVNSRTVVVLNTGGPVVMPWRNQVAGIIEAWYGGQMAGPAMAEVLAGVVDPSGRLPVTMPATAWRTPAAAPAQFPGRHGVVDFGGLSDIGYRWYQTQNVTPAFPFGYGLSYTSFSWSHVSVSPDPAGVHVSLQVTNTGSRAGVSVVQVYVAFPSAAGEPPEQLRGVGRVDLAAGASGYVRIDLPRSAFTYYDAHTWRVASGAYEVSVATSSAQFVATQALTLAG